MTPVPAERKERRPVTLYDKENPLIKIANTQRETTAA